MQSLEPNKRARNPSSLLAKSILNLSWLSALSDNEYFPSFFPFLFTDAFATKSSEEKTQVCGRPEESFSPSVRNMNQ